jgi:hypothetical protein
MINSLVLVSPTKISSMIFGDLRLIINRSSPREKSIKSTTLKIDVLINFFGVFFRDFYLIRGSVSRFVRLILDNLFHDNASLLHLMEQNNTQFQIAEWKFMNREKSLWFFASPSLFSYPTLPSRHVRWSGFV